MPTLLLSRRYSEDSNSMWRAAVDAGWDVERLHTYAVPEGIAERDPVVYGETLLADAVAEQIGLTLLEPAHDWLTTIPAEYCGRAVKMDVLGNVRSVGKTAFIKPVDEKIFRSRVYQPGESIDAERAFPDDSAVIVCEPIQFGLEVRAFVLERQVVALSAYMRDGDIAKDESGEWPLAPAEDQAARAFLQRVLANQEVALPPAVVVDVGEAVGLGWVVVEANPCWASGLCGCDPREVLGVVRRANVRTANLSDSDAPWSRTAHGLGLAAAP
jgi:hypothetical protein